MIPFPFPPRFASIFATLCLLAANVLASPARSDVEGFFKAGPTAPASLPGDQVFPRGTMFPFSFFSVGGGTEEKINALFPEAEVQKEFAHYKTLGIPIFGPQYELSDRSLADAGKHDLKVAYTVGLIMNFHDRSGEEKTAVKLTADEIFSQVREQVKAVMDNPRIAFWYLKPEELRPWRKAEMEYLEAASKAVRETDPLKRPLWIYDPNHASAKRLAAIAPWVDYLGKGMYPNYASQKDSRIWCRWSIEQEIEAIKTSGASALPIAVPEMFRQPEEADLPKIPTWVRHDVFLSLVTGAKGVIVFSARRRPNFPAREAYYTAYAEMAKHLIGPQNLGQVFLFGERRSDILVDITDGPAEVELLYPSGGVKEAIKYPSVSFLDVALGKDRYLFLVNSANEAVEAMVGGMPYNAVKAESLLDDAAAFDVGEGEFEIRLEPLQVKAFRLTRR